jgi:hypothetical protein
VTQQVQRLQHLREAIVPYSQICVTLCSCHCLLTHAQSAAHHVPVLSKFLSKDRVHVATSRPNRTQAAVLHCISWAVSRCNSHQLPPFVGQISNAKLCPFLRCCNEVLLLSVRLLHAVLLLSRVSVSSSCEGSRAVQFLESAA